MPDILDDYIAKWKAEHGDQATAVLEPEHKPDVLDDYIAKWKRANDIGQEPSGEATPPTDNYIADIIKKAAAETSVGLGVRALGGWDYQDKDLGTFGNVMAGVGGFVGDPATYLGGGLGGLATKGLIKAFGKETAEKLAVYAAKKGIGPFAARSAVAAIKPAVTLGTVEAARGAAVGEFDPARIAQSAATGALFGPAGQIPTAAGKLAGEVGAMLIPPLAEKGSLDRQDVEAALYTVGGMRLSGIALNKLASFAGKDNGPSRKDYAEAVDIPLKDVPPLTQRIEDAHKAKEIVDANQRSEVQGVRGFEEVGPQQGVGGENRALDGGAGAVVPPQEVGQVPQGEVAPRYVAAFGKADDGARFVVEDTQTGKVFSKHRTHDEAEAAAEKVNVTPKPQGEVAKPVEAKQPWEMRQSAFVSQASRELQGARNDALRKAERDIERAWNKPRPEGISAVQHFLVQEKLPKELKGLRSSYSVAKQNADLGIEGEIKTKVAVHRRLVENALAAGKPIPPEVLADYPDLAKQAPPPVEPVKPQASERLAQAEAAYAEAQQKLDELGPEPPKRRSEAKAFGTNGRENARPEDVARYDAEVKAHASWRRKYSVLKKDEVAKGNELFRQRQLADPSPPDVEGQGVLGEAGPGDIELPVSTAKATAPSEPLSARRILSKIENLWNVKLAIGKTRGAAGRYVHFGKKPGPQVIRLAKEFQADLAVASHELAHHIDRLSRVAGEPLLKTAPKAAIRELKAMDYKPERGKALEGFAELLRKVLIGEDTAVEAPNATRWYAERLNVKTDEAAKLGQTREWIKQFQDQGALERARSQVSSTGVEDVELPPGVKARNWWLTFRRAVQNDTAALQELDRQAAEKRPLKAGESAAKAAKVLRHSQHAWSQDALYRGVFSPVTGERLGPSVVDALRHLPDATEETWLNARDYLAARRSLELIDRRDPDTGESRGVRTGLPRSDWEYVRDHYEKIPGMKEFADTYRDVHAGLVKMLQEVGRYTPKQVQLIVDSSEAYAPIHHVKSSDAIGRIGGRLKGDPVKRVGEKGNEAQIIDPIAQGMRMAEHFYATAAQTIILQKITDLGATREGLGGLMRRTAPTVETTKMKIGDIADQLKKAGVAVDDKALGKMVALTRATQFIKGDDPTVVVFKDGKPQWWELDPALYEVVTNTAPYKLPPYLEATFGAATRLLRLGAVELRPRFSAVTNPLRDFQTAMIRTEGTTVGAPMRAVSALVTQISSAIRGLQGKGRDPLVELYNRWGGKSMGFIGQDVLTAHKTGREMMNSAHGREANNIIMHPVDALRRALSFTERTQRIAEMMSSLEKHGYTKADIEAGKQPPLEVMIEVMADAMNITTDFSTAGTVGRIANKFKAFTNAQIQDIATDARLLRDQPKRTILRGLAWLTVPSIAHWLMIRDEDWWKELPPWRKMLGFSFRAWGKTITIPTPFLLGQVFSRLPVMALDSLYQQDPQSAKDWVAQMERDYAPGVRSFLPDLLTPAVEVLMNRDFANRKIVPDYMAQYREPKDQYDDYTSAGSKYFGWLLNQSPKQLDHLLRSYTGGLGYDVSRIPDEGVGRALGTSSIARPTAYRSVNELEEAWSASQQKYGSMRASGKYDRDVAVEHRRLSHYNELIDKLRTVERKSKTQDEKDALRKRMVGLARKALGREPLESFGLKKAG